MKDREQFAAVSAAMRRIRLPADFTADDSWFGGGCDYIDYFGCWTSPQEPDIVAREIRDAIQASGIAANDVTYDPEKLQIRVRVDSGFGFFAIYSAYHHNGSDILGAIRLEADDVGDESPPGGGS